ncbi:hypothetical protein BS47DRAFT_1302366 [Hydnum rufescens UP504]|uniref:CxC1-like cysteine cluster associated with KDZ transposases domain-containing protein n=1 Tax=Hydnum rufescens UP504 TaxID=1448309 RepID=A0A9P6DRR7_9AGAM|nr:hypothetical protein BS47DRAFT_1302366 [Hydnum rufescens UP504]
MKASDSQKQAHPDANPTISSNVLPNAVLGIDGIDTALQDSISQEQLSVQYYITPLSTNTASVIDDKRSCHACRKHAQAHQWNNTVLPSLIHPYMKFWREQHHSSSLDESGQFICKCSSRHHTLEVTSIHMEWIEDVVLDVCECRSAPVQLVQCGFFPCTPVWPTLAVSLDMLEFISELFCHIAPNERGWVATLTKYLKTHGYCFAMGDSFCHCFANVLAHYQQLVELVDAEVEKLVDHS